MRLLLFGSRSGWVLPGPGCGCFECGGHWDACRCSSRKSRRRVLIALMFDSDVRAPGPLYHSKYNQYIVP